jgi:outer membrane protein assembly factor BamB
MENRKRNNSIRLSILTTTIMIVLFSIEMKAQDWPQWRGPNRDGVSKEANLNLNWEEKSPALLWTFRNAGAGYAAPTIVGSVLYSHGAAGGDDFAFAVDTKTGQLKWKQRLGDLFVMDRGDGSRGSVTVDGDKLYLIRGGGQLHCLSAADGKMLWQKDFRKDFGGNIMSRQDWGFSESPLVEGELVICTPGGEKGTMIALNKNTGETVWRSTEWVDLGGYSSPIIAEVAGVRQIIQLTRKGVAGVAVADGRLLWSAEVAGNNTAAIPTPIYRDGMVYVTSGYNAGCAGVRLTKSGDRFQADTVYVNKNMVNHHGGVVLVGDHLYGFSDASGWVCQHFKTGETIWKQRVRDVGKGTALAVNDRLLLQDERTGLLTLISASPEGWQEYGRMAFPERSEVASSDKMVWTHPVVVGGKLYLRDHDLIFCYDLKE